MHKSRLGVFVIDCESADMADAGRFWSAALGCPVGRSDDRYTELETAEGQPKLLLQPVEHPSRIHLDIEIAM